MFQEDFNQTCQFKPSRLNLQVRNIFCNSIQKYKFHKEHFKEKLQSRRISFHQEYKASKPPHSGQAFRELNNTKKPCLQIPFSNSMSNAYHRRQDNQICGSESNHYKTHQPKDEAGVIWQKTSKECLPRYLDKDRKQKIKYVADKLNNDFEKRRKTGQCFPTRK